MAYQKAKQVADEIFILSKSFPPEERYSLNDQISRSSRSVCASIAEAYRKRQYVAHFVSKLTDADMENGETEVWLDFSRDCNYVTIEKYEGLMLHNEAGKLLHYMIDHPEKFIDRS